MKELIKKCTLAMIATVAFTSLFAQSENFEQGEIAFNEGRKRDALLLLNKAVHNDIYLMKGKEIPKAYAYLAIIRNEYLEKKLEGGTLSTLKENPGLLNSTISDVKNALKFQDNGSKLLINRAQSQLIKNAMTVGHIVTDSLLKIDLDNDLSNAQNLATVLNYELKDLSDIDKENWELHDMIGLSYYILDEKDLAMLEFKRSRDIYNEQGATDLSDIHLYNCIYSTQYNYKVTKNYVEAYAASVDGKKFVGQMMQEVDSDSIHHLKKLATMDGTFSSIQDRVENMNIISSTKE
ncbi:hypothetical protein [Reichenbachiella ulvae]|uniref:Tetratricopeptide repeat-containing protein n=1 Tax=Reichenbachiella ulvae TaxID=2980104 RepID=A0ABT3CQB4_9BACT|nr:hypothetical protein [Reichenbachiella ulvae]MCV9385807.1 hypothetical protein [Reichenbachiella ulvae]